MVLVEVSMSNERTTTTEQHSLPYLKDLKFEMGSIRALKVLPQKVVAPREECPGSNDRKASKTSDGTLIFGREYVVDSNGENGDQQRG